MRKEGLLSNILRYLVYAVIITVTVYPLLFMIFVAFKNPREFMENFWLPPRPGGFTIDNLIKVWFDFKFYVYFTNSLIVNAAATLFGTFISLMCGYSFARLRFPFKEQIFILMLSVMFLPPFVYIIPLFSQLKNVNMSNTLAGLALVYTVFSIPTSMFIARNFFYSIPKEINESCLVDGAGQIKIFFRIILPIAKPAVSCIAIFCFINNWGEYIWALVLNTKEQVKTIPIALTYFTTQTNVFWWNQMAALFIATIPVILVYLIFSKAFIQGFVEGAIKG